MYLAKGKLCPHLMTHCFTVTIIEDVTARLGAEKFRQTG